jgi:hypothetical protein
MEPRTVIVEHIDRQLRHHLGEGVDAHRTLHDARYARDVLLVCDAMKDTDLPTLARQFRAAGEHMAAEQQRRLAPGHHAGPAQPWAEDTSGFGVSRPPESAPTPARKPWYLPTRWLS